MAGTFLPMRLQNEAMEAEVLFITGVGAGKFLRVQRIFDRIFPNLTETFCEHFAYKFYPTKIMKSFFWCELQKRSSCVFMQTLGVIF